MSDLFPFGAVAPYAASAAGRICHASVLFFLMAAALAQVPAAMPQTQEGAVSEGKPNKDVPKLGPAVGKDDAIAAMDCQPVDFTQAQLLRRDDRVLLKVAGEAPHPGMVITVRPVLYVKQPEYWLMALVACAEAGTALTGPATAFSAEINVGGSVGMKGIELAGRPGSKPVRLELAG